MNKKKIHRVAFNTSELDSLRKQTFHRLEHRRELLTPEELSFLMHMAEWLAFNTWLSVKQGNWLVAILERTSTKKLKRQHK